MEHADSIQAFDSNTKLAQVTGTGGACGTMGYLNRNSGWADAEASMRFLRTKVVAKSRVRFISVGVERLLFSGEGEERECVGVDLQDGNFLSGDLIILAAGAWSPSLIDLRGRVIATGQVVAYIEITSEEASILAKLPVQLNMSTGMFFIPPPPPDKLPQPAGQHSKGKFYLKIARHAYGYLNPTTIPNPENLSEQITISLPHTNPDHPLGAQQIPQEALVAMREYVNTIIPASSPLAAIPKRPWQLTRICHYADTPTSDWLLSYHPTYNKTLFVATGGSGHGFKFVPVIGEKIVDCLLEKCPKGLSSKWAWRDQVDGEKWAGDGSRSGPQGMILSEEMKKSGGQGGESKI
jgi:sarcosine oxidase/L-pipecolate oxidase